MAGESDNDIIPEDTKLPVGPTGGVTRNLDDEDQTLPVVQKADASAAGRGVKAMLNVGLEVQVVLGSTRMPINQLLELSRGSVVELDRKIGAPVELYVAERMIARGDLVKVGEDRLGVSLTQIVKDHVDG